MCFGFGSAELGFWRVCVLFGLFVVVLEFGNELFWSMSIFLGVFLIFLWLIGLVYWCCLVSELCF